MSVRLPISFANGLFVTVCVSELVLVCVCLCVRESFVASVRDNDNQRV